MTDTLKREADLTQRLQKNAANEVQTQEIQLKTALEEYENLYKRVTTLPDKLNHNIMVPFGNLAFIPGKIVHTNEFMIHLGDSWFANMSAKQVLGLIERRKSMINKNIKDLNVVMENINQKRNFVKDEFGDNVIDIKEELPFDYVPKHERKREGRTKTKKRHVVEPPKDLKENQLSKHEELMKRLDDLEKEELGETISSDDSEFEYENITKNKSKIKSAVETIKFKHTNTLPSKSQEINPGNIAKIKFQKTHGDRDNSTNQCFFAVTENVVETTAPTETNTTAHEKRTVSRFRASKLQK